MTPDRIAIVGASVAGLSLAWALKRRGIEATVYERSSGLLAHQGAGVMLSESLIETLQLSEARPVTRRCYVGTSGQVLWEQSVTKYAAGWGDVYGSLRRHAGDIVLYEDCKVEQTELDPPTLRFASREAQVFDLIVGADGIGSIVRPHLDPNFTPRYLGYVAIRGLIPRSQLPDGLPAITQDLFRDTMMKLVMDGEHVVLYGLPSDDEHLNWMWYANLNESALARLLTDRHGRKHRWSLPPGTLSPAAEDELRAMSAARLPAWMDELVSATETLFLQPIFDGVATQTVGSGLALVGDAAHLAVPHVGAGVTLAVEDSFTLAEALADNSGSLASRLGAWSASRRATVTERLSLALRLGLSLQSGGQSWDSWSADRFNSWWDTLLASTPVDKSV